MAYFTPEEFKCKHCGKMIDIDEALMTRLNALRASYGKPMYVASGYRCEEYNKVVGGVSESAHTTGHAVDIFCNASRDRYYLLSQAVGLFKRIGVGKSFLHLDTDLTKDQEVIWLYGNH